MPVEYFHPLRHEGENRRAPSQLGAESMNTPMDRWIGTAITAAGKHDDLSVISSIYT